MEKVKDVLLFIMNASRIRENTANKEILMIVITVNSLFPLVIILNSLMKDAHFNIHTQMDTVSKPKEIF